MLALKATVRTTVWFDRRHAPGAPIYHTRVTNIRTVRAIRICGLNLRPVRPARFLLGAYRSMT